MPYKNKKAMALNASALKHLQQARNQLNQISGLADNDLEAKVVKEYDMHQFVVAQVIQYLERGLP